MYLGPPSGGLVAGRVYFRGRHPFLDDAEWLSAWESAYIPDEINAPPGLDPGDGFFAHAGNETVHIGEAERQKFLGKMDFVHVGDDTLTGNGTSGDRLRVNKDAILQIATRDRLGGVKASDDVRVDPLSGAMSVPALPTLRTAIDSKLSYVEVDLTTLIGNGTKQNPLQVIGGGGGGGAGDPPGLLPVLVPVKGGFFVDIDAGGIVG